MRLPIGVMHVTDTLEAGGLERMSVNLVNRLPRERYRPYLCTTRREGPLAELVSPDVGRLALNRRWRGDLRAVRRLASFIGSNEIRLLHAHGSSLFIAASACLLAPRTVLLWHDHFGPARRAGRSPWLYRLAASRVSGVIAVSRDLADWARGPLGLPPERIWHIPNFLCEPAAVPSVDPPGQALPGEEGQRIVCVANFRPEKDLLCLIEALPAVLEKRPRARLALVGSVVEPAYHARVLAKVRELGLEGSVSVLGPRRDVFPILRRCDIGVLSSTAEGLPLALLEYGSAGLAVACTAVGDCPEVLEGGKAGILVPPQSPEKLGRALLALLESEETRKTLSCRLRERVRSHYSAEAVMSRVERVYEELLDLR